MHFLAFFLQSPEVQGTIGHQAEVLRIHFHLVAHIPALQYKSNSL